MIFDFFSSPPTILSTASRKSCLPTVFFEVLAAINAASLQTFAISAPENPGVCLAKKLMSIFFNLIGFKMYFKYLFSLYQIR